MSAKESVHELVVRTFDGPTKCDVCTSVMFGLVRQGLVCKSKSYCMYIGAHFLHVYTCTLQLHCLPTLRFCIQPTELPLWLKISG